MRTHRVVFTLLTLQVLTASNAFAESAVVIQDADSLKAFQNATLSLHNQYRARHGTPPLKWDKNLANRAIQCANYYVAKGTIDHSCPSKNGAGENLVGGSGWPSTLSEAATAVKMWYDEVMYYNFANPGFSMATGHFTQVVWKNSTQLGCGVALTKAYTAVVCLYSPPGNYQGQFPANVLPRKP